MGNGTVIDSLVVSLGLDPKDFDKGTKQSIESLRKFEKESTKSNKSMTHEAGKSLDVYKKMRNEIGGLVTAFLSVGAIKAFVGEITKADAAISRTARNTGTTTKDLTLVGGMMERVGGQATDATQTFHKFSDSIADLTLTGQPSSALVFFRNLGVNIEDAHQKAKPLLQVLRETSRAIADKKLSPEIAQSLGRQAGVSESFMNLALKTPAELEIFIKQQEKLYSLSESQAKNAEARQQAQSEMMQKLKDIGTKLVDDLTPGILKLAHFAELLVDKLGAWLGENVTTPPIGKQQHMKNNIAANNLQDLIAQAESGGNYNATNKNGKSANRWNLSSMTINEIIAAQEQGKWGASGKYQMLKGGLKDAIAAGVVDGNEKFSEKTQDLLYKKYYAYKKQPSVRNYIEGKSDDINAATKGMGNEFEVIQQGKIPIDKIQDYLKAARQEYMIQNGGSTTSSEIHINNLNVHTQATDAQGIAGDIVPQLVAQANTAYS